MASINNNSWMVTFIYAQDLRSSYMNGILNAGFRPGIYNADLAVFAARDVGAGSGSQEKSDGIFLHIKKGSTFIFSNNYKLRQVAGSSVYERDLNNIGTYLIKCVALEDVIQPLITWKSADGPGPAAIAVLGNNRAYKHYIVAKMRYNDREERNPYIPVFTLAQSNTTYTSKAPEYLDNIYLVQPYPTNNPPTYKAIEDLEFQIPDGSKTYFNKTSQMREISWLCLGAILEKRDGFRETSSVPSYLEGDAKWAPNADSMWTKNHVLTARGIPDYRQSIVASTTGDSPDLIIDNKASRLYLDTGYIYDSTNVHYTSNNWKDVQRVGAASDDETPIGDLTYDLRFAEGETLDGFANSLKATSSSPDVNSMIVVDAVFLASKNKISDNNQDIRDIFTTDKYNGTKTVGYRWAARIPDDSATTGVGGNFAPAYDSELEAAEGYVEAINHRQYSYSGTSLKGKLISPLDTCKANLNRLLDIVSDKPIIPQIINSLRHITSITPKLSATLNAADMNTLIPVCLVFRKFVKKAVPVEVSEKKYVWKAVDDFSSENQVHPANILNMLDLQYRTTSVPELKISSEDVYTLIPVID